MTIRTDIFRKGQPFAMGADQDFNKEFGLAPGDAVQLADGMEYIDIGRLNGITFFSETPVEIGSITFHGACFSPRLIGKDNSIKLVKADRFGCMWEAVGTMEIAGVHAAGCLQGFQVLSKPENAAKYIANVQNIYIHDCLVEDSAYEALYLGHYIAGSPCWINGKVERVVVRRAGNDGIQCRNGYFEVLNNTLEDIGLGGNDSHAQGILFGGNTKNGIARGNKLARVAGYGIFANGFGDFLFEDNQIQSASSCVFTKNHEPEQDLQKVGYQKFTVKNNTLLPGNGKPVEAYYKTGSVPSTVIYQGNSATGTPYIEQGVTFVTVIPSEPVPVPQVPAPAKKLLWTAYKVMDGKRKYYNVYSDHTWQWK